MPDWKNGDEERRRSQRRHSTRRECDQCQDHSGLVNGYSTLKWMFGGICALAVVILGLVISLTGEVKTMTAVSKSSITLMQKQIDHISKIQQSIVNEKRR